MYRRRGVRRSLEPSPSESRVHEWSVELEQPNAEERSCAEVYNCADFAVYELQPAGVRAQK